MKTYEKTVESTGGLNTLKGVVFEPDGEIRGIVQIVHDKGEHVGRYAPLMEALCAAGFVAFGHDQIGHRGTSADGDLGFFGYDHGFRTVINDVNAFGDAVAADYPDKKRFLYGHGMGSHAVRLAVLDRPGRFSGVIVSGTSGPGRSKGRAACNAVIFAKGGKFVSPRLEARLYGGYNERFEGESENRWLSSLEDEVRAYDEDRYCGFPFTACGLSDVTRLAQVCNKKIWAQAIDKNLPLFLVSGGDDPAGEYGEGVRTVYGRLVSAGCDAQMKLYPAARHDIHNDVSRDELVSDVIKFIEEHI